MTNNYLRVFATFARNSLVRDMTLVTRNLRDIADTGVTVLDPWEA